MSNPSSLTNKHHTHTEESPHHPSEGESSPSNVLSWWSERKARHERIQAAKQSGLVPTWGWTPEKPMNLKRAISEPAVPVTKEERKLESVEQKVQRDTEWAKVGGMLEGIAESRQVGQFYGYWTRRLSRSQAERDDTPRSPPAASTSAPAGESHMADAIAAAAAAKKAEREKMERYSIMESI